MERLTRVLQQIGKPVTQLGFADGTRLVALPFGGRVLGLFPPDSEENFLWTNPALESADSAMTLFDGHAWPNTGGDRTWLAPEIDLFIGDLARPAETYGVPPALDPGAWQVTAHSENSLSLRMEAELRLLRSRCAIRVVISKRIQLARSPLPDILASPPAVRYAGYEQVTGLELGRVAAPAASPVRIGLWNLLQLPQPGQMLIATRRRSRPRVVFGLVAPGEVDVRPELVRWRMGSAAGAAKLAVKARCVSGRVGYAWRSQADDTWNLVVRQFDVDRRGVYVDALWDRPSETGFGVQACRVTGELGAFNELEYHAPAVTVAAGSRRCEERSRVWAFRGPFAEVARIAGRLLGVEVLTQY